MSTGGGYPAKPHRAWPIEAKFTSCKAPLKRRRAVGGDSTSPPNNNWTSLCTMRPPTAQNSVSQLSSNRVSKNVEQVHFKIADNLLGIGIVKRSLVVRNVAKTFKIQLSASRFRRISTGNSCNGTKESLPPQGARGRLANAMIAWDSLQTWPLAASRPLLIQFQSSPPQTLQAVFLTIAQNGINHHDWFFSQP